MKLKPALALLVLPLAISSAYAEDGDGMPTFTFSGFGSETLTKSNTDDAEFARPNQLKGVTTHAKNGVDSNFGFQATAKFNDWLSFTGQGLVSKIVTDEFSGHLSLGFAKAKISDNLFIRVGRVGLPLYFISDSREIGYANTMIRPVVEVYGQAQVGSIDGVDVVYQTSIGDTSLSAQFVAGQIDVPNKSGFTVNFTKTVSTNLTVENGPFSARLGYSQANVNVSDYAAINGLVANLRKFGFTTVADNMDIIDKKGSFISLGGTLDWKNIVVQTEFGKRKVDSLAFPNTSSWYTMVGYRMGKFLPYFNHASAKQDTPRTVAGLPTSGPFLGLTLGANSVAGSAPLQTSNSVGLRWDFYKSAAFKMQLDRFSPENGAGTFTKAKPGFTGPVNVSAAGVLDQHNAGLQRVGR